MYLYEDYMLKHKLCLETKYCDRLIVSHLILGCIHLDHNQPHTDEIVEFQYQEYQEFEIVHRIEKDLPDNFMWRLRIEVSRIKSSRYTPGY